MTAEELKAMRGGDVLALVSNTLLKRAEEVRELEESLIRIGHSTSWHSGNKEAHDAMCAAAEVIERIRATGKDQVERKVKVDRLVELSVDVCRSTLIAELLKRDNAPATVAPSSEPDEAAA